LTNERPLLLDITRLVWRRWIGRLPTGIDRVCLAYLDRYRSESQAVIQRRGFRRILSQAASDRLFEALAAPEASLRMDMVRIIGSERLRSLRALSGKGRLYLNLGHTALQDQGYLAWTRAAAVRPVYMVHDLIPITHPEFCREGETQRHAQRMRNMLASAVGIIGNSQATLDSLEAFAASISMGAPAETAAPLGTQVRHSPPAAIEIPEQPTFVVLGTIEGRKNHLMLLRVWARLVRAYGLNAPRLLVIGQRGWKCQEVFDLLDRSEALRGAVIEVGDCSDAELNGHLSSTRALLFPSLAEGYGLPLVEALSAGTPVIASDLPVFREIGQGVPDLLNPLDDFAWEQAILSYAGKDSAAREAQIARLAGYRAPTWDEHFELVDAWLATL
jgi:glycosyltransferase involved in cell wall biosynthesis